MTPLGLFGSLGSSLLAFTLHRLWSIGVNLSLNLHHAPSTAMSHPTPAHHKPRATSYATVLSITHHTKGANLPWFLNWIYFLTCTGCHTIFRLKIVVPMVAGEQAAKLASFS